MRYRHRIAAAGALIGLAVAASWWTGSGSPGSQWEPRHLRVSSVGGRSGSAWSAGALRREGYGGGERASSKALERPALHASQPPAVRARFAEQARAIAPSDELPEARSRDAEPVGQLQPLVVLSAERTPGRVTGELLGIDPYAPRELVLWRIAPDGGRAAAIARGASAGDGRFRFPAALLPHARVRLAVTPRGAEPGGPGASPPFEVAEGAVEPPKVELFRDGGPWRLRVRWARPGATLLVADASGRELARRGLGEAPGSVRGLELELEIDMQGEAVGADEGESPPGPRALLVAQRLADGRRSTWRAVAPSSRPSPHDEYREDEHQEDEHEKEGEHR